jgi:hypothetical protein
MKEKVIAALAAALVVAFTSDLAADPYIFDQAPEEGSPRASERENRAYEQGTDAIDEADWETAVRRFRAVIEMKGARADDAMYWAAYALNRLSRRTEALQTLETLEKNYPSSAWIDDAKALALEVRQQSGERVAPETVDDVELKIMAINSLMHTDPAKAYPLLEKILKGPYHPNVKKQAVFVLSQSRSPQAQKLLADIARGAANPDLQKEAVQFLGVAGGEGNRKVLADLYASATSREVKEEILQSLMVANDRGRLLQVARAERDSELRGEAVRLLGAMNARADLATLYASETSREVKESILEALFIAGDGQKLAELARAEKDPELRYEAIRSLGLVGRSTAPTLLAIYDAETSAEAKELFVQGNARALIDLSKKEKNRAVRREIIEKLSVMGDDEAVAYMLQLLEE